MGKYIIIDGIEFPVAIVELKRKADILDKTANRTEDGDLHREVIGTYINYSMKIGIVHDLVLYEKLFAKLSEPVPFHTIEMPNDHIKFQGYFGSVNDEVSKIDPNTGETTYKGLSCNIVARLPRRRP